MTSLLLMISFLLHIVVLWVVMQLFQQMQTMKQQHENEKHSIETAFKIFFDDMKVENKQLLDALQGPQVMPEHEETKAAADEIQAEDAKQPLYELPIEKDDKIETSITGQIFQLHESGATVEEIAKKLNKGKTEIDLILKLHTK